jgi:hypothetical protein
MATITLILGSRFAAQVREPLRACGGRTAVRGCLDGQRQRVVDAILRVADGLWDAGRSACTDVTWLRTR